MIQDYPVSNYYKGRVIEAVTLSKSKGWWSAILLIEDPRSGLPFINLYKWQETDSGWKNRNRFKISNKEEAEMIMDIMRDFIGNLY